MPGGLVQHCFYQHIVLSVAQQQAGMHRMLTAVKQQADLASSTKVRWVVLTLMQMVSWSTSGTLCCGCNSDTDHHTPFPSSQPVLESIKR